MEEDFENNEDFEDDAPSGINDDISSYLEDRFSFPNSDLE